MQEAHANGVARAIGVDRMVPAQIAPLLAGPAPHPSVLMASIGVAGHDDATLAYAQANGITFNGFSIMKGCAFTDPTIVQLAAKYNATPGQICATWTRQRGCTMAL